MRLFFVFTVLSSLSTFVGSAAAKSCRTTAGDPRFPSLAQWKALNASVSGRLVPAVPSVQFCESLSGGNCTLPQWSSSVFRNSIPGAMNQVNWEQDYESQPPSLCLLGSSGCGQGNVPLFALLATSASDIATGLQFARTHNLRIAVKASGHDYLGRSTAKSSLLISTHKLQNITFTEDFIVGKKNKGTAVTVGSGVTLSTLYGAARAQGKVFVGGTAATVVAAGGYFQGAGHSSLSPTFGLAADNTLEVNIVLANGTLVRANEQENSDLFWAIRGGGAGSWGVITSATFRTFPTFNASVSQLLISATSAKTMGNVATAHAKHIFDWDSLRAGQYFYLSSTNFTGVGVPGNPTGPGLVMFIVTFFPNATTAQADAALQPFIKDVKAQGAVITQQTAQSEINAALLSADDLCGGNLVLGSRLIPASTYRHSPETIGEVYEELLKGGATNILGNLVAGGKVAENANISSAVNPKWRTAKTHIIVANTWDNDSPLKRVRATQTLFRDKQLPILERLAGHNAGAYSGEADVLERDFQKTFFGPNYARLSQIKQRYDPNDLFIVRAGVGSERWDDSGLCQV